MDNWLMRLLLIAVFYISYCSKTMAISSSQAQSDSLEIWIENCTAAAKDLRPSVIIPYIEKFRSLSGKEIKSKAQAFANLFEAEISKKSDLHKTINSGSLAFEYFDTHDEYYHATRAKVLVAIATANQGKTQEALELYEECLVYAQEHSNPINDLESYILKINYNIGFVLIRYGDLDRAVQYISKAIEQAQAQKDTLVWAHGLNMFGNINIRRNQHEEAIKYNREGLELLDMIGSNSKAYLEGAIGASFMELGQLDSAKFYLERVIKTRRADNNQYSLAVGLINLSEIYRQENDCNTSDRLNREVRAIAKANGMSFLNIDAIVNLCICHNSQQEYQEAEKIAKEGISILDSTFIFSIASELYECASEAAMNQNKHKEALAYYKLHKANADSLLNEESESTIEELEIKYESKQKQIEIEQLEEEAILKSVVYKNRILWLFASLFGMFSVAGGIYFFYRNKMTQVEKRKLEIEQKLLRSQMNPHFIFNAISSIQNFLFDKSDLKTALSYLTNFAELMRETLEHSRERNISLKREIQSLENYLVLQQLRYQNQFQYEVIVDPNIDPEEVLVPPLIAQPFVENAIEHGQIHQIEDGKVIIKFDLHANSLRLSIRDNGVGLHNSTNFKVERISKNSLSTIITKERLAALSKESKQKLDVLIENISPAGTLVTIDLPKIYAS